nr:hypothetical protein [uncultured Devosia sp.]
MLGLPAAAATNPDMPGLAEVARRGSAVGRELAKGIMLPTGIAGGKYLLADELVITVPGRPIRVCTACIAQDLDGADRLCMEAAAYERRHWVMADYVNCHVHDLPLIELQADHADFAEAIRGSMESFTPMPAMPSDPTIWHFVAGRLAGEPTTCAFLKYTPVQQAVGTCIALGSIDLFGAKTFFKLLVPSDAHLALRRGFDLCREGENAVARLLDRVIEDAQLQHGQGLTGAFGRLIGFLSGQGKIGGYVALREQMVAAAHRNGLYGRSTTTLLGLDAPLPEVWTVSELAEGLRAGEKTILGLLRQLGHLQRHGAVGDLFITDAVAEDLRTYRDGINAVKAAGVLGLRHKFVKELVGLKALNYALERHSADGKPLRLFWPADLEEFKVKIFGNCLRFKRRILEHRLPIARAAANVGRSTGFVLAILQRKACDWAFVTPNTTRLDAIMVDVGQLRAEVCRDMAAYVVPQVARILGVDRKNVSPLIALGILKNCRERNGVNLRWQIVVEEADLNAFRRTYVSVTALSQFKSNVAQWMVKYLDAQGVIPLPTPTRFYLWDDLRKLTGIVDEAPLKEALYTASRRHMAEHVWYSRKRDIVAT